MAMTYQPLRSQALAGAGYDPTTLELELEFTTGETYTYYGVLPTVYAALVKSSSPGGFYNANIKGNYQFGQIAGSLLSDLISGPSDPADD